MSEGRQWSGARWCQAQSDSVLNITGPHVWLRQAKLPTVCRGVGQVWAESSEGTSFQSPHTGRPETWLLDLPSALLVT